MQCISLFTVLFVLATKSTAHPNPGLEPTHGQPDIETTTLQWPSADYLDIQPIIDKLNSQIGITTTNYDISKQGECNKLQHIKTKDELLKGFKLCVIEISKNNGNTSDLSNQDMWVILGSDSKNELDFWQIIVNLITAKIKEKGKESAKGGLREQLLEVATFILNSFGKLLVGLNLTGKEVQLENILKLVVDRLPDLLFPGKSPNPIGNTAPVGGLLADILHPVGGLLEQYLGGADGAADNILGLMRNLLDKFLNLLCVLFFGPELTWGKKDNEIIVGLIPGFLDLLEKILGKGNVEVTGGVLSKLLVLMNELINKLLRGDIKTCVGKEGLHPLLGQLLQDFVGAVKKLMAGLLGSGSSSCGADTLKGIIATILKGMGGILEEVVTQLHGDKSDSTGLGGFFGLLGDLLGGKSKPQGSGTGWLPGNLGNQTIINPGGPEIPAGQPIIGTWFPQSGNNGTSDPYNYGQCKKLDNATTQDELEKIFKLCAIEINKQNGNTDDNDTENIWEILGHDNQNKVDFWQIIISFITEKVEEKGKESLQGGLVEKLLNLVLFILKSVGSLLFGLDDGGKKGLLDTILQLVVGRLPSILFPASGTEVDATPVGGLLAGIVNGVGGLLEALLGNGGTVDDLLGLVKNLLDQVLTFLGVLLFGKPEWGQKDNEYMIGLIPGLLDLLVKILGKGTVDELVGKEGLVPLLGQFLQEVVEALKKLLTGLLGSGNSSCDAGTLNGLLATILKGMGGILEEVLTLLLGDKSGSTGLLGGLLGLVGDLLGGTSGSKDDSGKTGGLLGLVGDLLGGEPETQGDSGTGGLLDFDGDKTFRDLLGEAQGDSGLMDGFWQVFSLE